MPISSNQWQHDSYTIKTIKKIENVAYPYPLNGIAIYSFDLQVDHHKMDHSMADGSFIIRFMV